MTRWSGVLFQCYTLLCQPSVSSLPVSVPFLFSSGGPLGYTKGLVTLWETFARKERLLGDFGDGRSFDSEDYTSCNLVRALATDRFCLSGKSILHYSIFRILVDFLAILRITLLKVLYTNVREDIRWLSIPATFTCIWCILHSFRYCVSCDQMLLAFVSLYICWFFYYIIILNVRIEGYVCFLLALFKIIHARSGARPHVYVSQPTQIFFFFLNLFSDWKSIN